MLLHIAEISAPFQYKDRVFIHKVSHHNDENQTIYAYVWFTSKRDQLMMDLSVKIWIL